MADQKEAGHKIRDARTEKRFFVDNAIIREYGPDIGVYGIAVYAALCMHADKDDQDCWPSHSTIAKEIGCSPRKVRDVLTELEKFKLIAISPRYRDNGGQTSNEYVLLDPPARGATPPGTEDTPPQYREVPTNNPHIEQSPSEQEDAASAALFWGPDGKPQREEQEQEPLPETGDPLALAAECQRRNGGKKPMSVPEAAGGADPFADKPLRGFCALSLVDPDKMPDKRRRSWTRKLRAIAEEVHATPQRLYEAIRELPDHPLYGWIHPTSPFSTSFIEAVQNIICGVEGDGSYGGDYGRSGNRAHKGIIRTTPIADGWIKFKGPYSLELEDGSEPLALPG